MSERERTVRAAYDAWTRDDIPAYLATLHPEVVIRPVLGGSVQADEYRGHEGALRWIEEAKGEWSDFEMHVVEVVERGDRVVNTVRIRARGRASGALTEGVIHHLGSFRDGLIASIEGFTDRADALKRLESS